MEDLLARAKEGAAQQAGAVRACRRATSDASQECLIWKCLCFQGLITAPEAEHLIEALRSVDVDQVTFL